MKNKSLDKTDLPNRSPGAAALPCHVAWLVLILSAGAVYMLTLNPGVLNGDSAEMQLMCALLGVCHPPGYCFEVVVGKLFSLLPIGPDAAWRINFMQTVCGLIGLFMLFAVLRRLIGQIVPALIAVMTLAFSAVYWMHCVEAEVYVFHAMFLILGLYALVRFRERGAAGWLYMAAATLGICIGNRLSEVFILPGLLILASPIAMRRHLNWKRLLTAGVLALAPFAFNLGFYMIRANPALLHARDDARRDALLGLDVATPADSLSSRLKNALSYCTGLSGAGREDFTAFSWARLGWDVDKYAWHLSGAAVFGERFSSVQRDRDAHVAFQQREQGPGASIGLLGVLLALFGLRRWRTHRRVVSAGAAMFAGNFLYYLYMHPVDNLHFTIPGLVGLTLLIGLGVSSGNGRTSSLQLAALLAPAFLLFTNYGAMDYRSPKYDEQLALAARIKATPLPQNATIIATYPRAQRLRFLYWVEAGLEDVNVFVYRERYGSDELQRLVTGLRDEERYILFSSEAVGVESTRVRLARWTPREYVDIGLYLPFPYRQTAP